MKMKIRGKQFYQLHGVHQLRRYPLGNFPKCNQGALCILCKPFRLLVVVAPNCVKLWRYTLNSGNLTAALLLLSLFSPHLKNRNFAEGRTP